MLDALEIPKARFDAMPGPPRRSVKRRAWVQCPQTMPLLSFVYGLPGSHVLRFADSTTPDVKRKPDDATGLQLFLAISDQRPAPLADARFLRLITKNPIEVQFKDEDDGKAATYYARWVSARGETGPWSLPIHMTIAM